ncbi:hypothetical protein [Teichococcus wenyumeiae]|uniref:hypothetical protein n=1 Tax=Teichococcus wenyumeiae TaxID=2478470 RepID=UPI00131405C2|nr:hypothetical protein [Pseudoroseomonas wenyumeiae]
MTLLLLLYVLTCLAVAWAGRGREIGFAGFLVLSILITPLVTALILLVSAPRQTRI